MSKTVLITGAAGFTGRYFISLANKMGFNCIALTYADNGMVSGCSKTLVADLSNKVELKKQLEAINFDYVLHLAAISFVGHDNCEQIYSTNLQGTINLLDIISELGISVKKILLASSGNVYGNNINLPIDESNTPYPQNDYGVSKLAMEFAAQIRAEKLPIVITRPFNYTGIGQAENFLVPKIVAHFSENKKTIELGNIDVFRDFSDVRDVVKDYIDILTNEKSYGIYNVCSGKSTSLREIIDILSELAKYKINITVNPNFVRENEIKVLFGSDNKLRKLLGGKVKYSIKDTLGWMYNIQSSHK